MWKQPLQGPAVNYRHDRHLPSVKTVLLLSLMIASMSEVFAAEGMPEGTLSALIIDGQNNHDWDRGTKIISAILRGSGRFAVDVSTTPPAKSPPAQWDAWQPVFRGRSLLIVNYNGERWPTRVETAFEDYVKTGGGVVCVHAANNAFPAWPAYNEMIGLGWRGSEFWAITHRGKRQPDHHDSTRAGSRTRPPCRA